MFLLLAILTQSHLTCVFLVAPRKALHNLPGLTHLDIFSLDVRRFVFDSTLQALGRVRETKAGDGVFDRGGRQDADFDIALTHFYI